jgi:hypothetical protein
MTSQSAGHASFASVGWPSQEPPDGDPWSGKALRFRHGHSYYDWRFPDAHYCKRGYRQNGFHSKLFSLLGLFGVGAGGTSQKLTPCPCPSEHAPVVAYPGNSARPYRHI